MKTMPWGNVPKAIHYQDCKKQKAPPVAGLPSRDIAGRFRRLSNCLNLRGLFALLAHCLDVADLLAFLQRLEAIAFNRREMREQVVAACVRVMKPKPLASLNHLTVPVSIFLSNLEFQMSAIARRGMIFATAPSENSFEAVRMRGPILPVFFACQSD